MRMYYLLRITFYLMVILGLCFTLHVPISISLAESPPPQTDEPQHILRIGTILPADVSYMKYNAGELREVEELTDHRVKFELYAGGVLGDEPAMVKMVQEGKLDIAAVTALGLEGVAPETLVLSLPYLFRDEYEMEFILEKYESIFTGYARERGIEILGLFTAGSSPMFSTVPITSPEELQNKKVMCIEKSQFFTEFFRSARWQSSVPLSFAEVEPALNSGKVEVVFGPPAMVVVMGWYPHIRYVVMESVAVGTGVFITNSDLYQSFPEEIRSTMTKFIREIRKKSLKRLWRDNEIAMLGLMKRGVKIIRWSPKDMEKLREDAKKFWDYGVGKWYSRKLLDDILRDLEEYRASKDREGSR